MLNVHDKKARNIFFFIWLQFFFQISEFQAVRCFSEWWICCLKKLHSIEIWFQVVLNSNIKRLVRTLKFTQRGVIGLERNINRSVVHFQAQSGVLYDANLTERNLFGVFFTTGGAATIFFVLTTVSWYFKCCMIYNGTKTYWKYSS